ncbi:hypothetical protein Tco_1363622 [Tanacetum coccineum]
MGKDCKSSTVKLDKSMSLIMTTSKMTLTPRMGVNEWLQFQCTFIDMSDVEEGGETVFPSAKGNISDVPWWNELSECGKEGLFVKPKMGDALLF